MQNMYNHIVKVDLLWNMPIMMGFP